MIVAVHPKITMTPTGPSPTDPSQTDPSQNPTNQVTKEQ